MDIVEFADKMDFKLLNFQKKLLTGMYDMEVKRTKTDEECKKCKKDWTKCGKCPVMMKWIKEQKVRKNES